MRHDRIPPPRRAALQLNAISASQLSELAMHYDRTMDEAAMIAIYMAYLGLLEGKRDAAMQALNLALGDDEPDEELPF